MSLSIGSNPYEPLLHNAVRNKLPRKYLTKLLFSGMPPNELNRKGQTPLDVAIAVNAVKAAVLLISNGAVASDKKQLETWISTKSDKEIDNLLHAGFQPTCYPPEQLSLSVRVFWIQSRQDWLNPLRVELYKLASDPDRFQQFVTELAHQKRNVPFFQAMAPLIKDPDVILFGLGFKAKCPTLNKHGWNFLDQCIKAEILTHEDLSNSLSEANNTKFCIRALESLPNEKPSLPFYDQYVRHIKLGLIGTMWKPSEQTLSHMAEKLEWHPMEWFLLQRFYDMPATAKRSAKKVDPAIECYLQGLDALKHDQEQACDLFLSAGSYKLPRANVETGRLLLKEHLATGLSFIRKAVDQDVHRAYQFLALSPNIPFSTLKVSFDIPDLIRRLQDANDPAGEILASRKAVYEPNTESVWLHAEKLWETVFKKEAEAALGAIANKTSLPLKANRAFLEKCADEGNVVALAGLARRSVLHADRLLELSHQENALARKFAIQVCRSSRVKWEVEKLLRSNIPLQWILEEKGIDLISIFRKKKTPDLKEISNVVTSWSDETRKTQAQLLKEYLPKKPLLIFEEPSTENFEYLKNLRGLLPFLAEVNPSIKRLIRSYKEFFFRDPFAWSKNESLSWMPCSSEDTRVIDKLEDIRYDFTHSNLSDLLPGQQEFLEALQAIEDELPARADELFETSLEMGFNPAGIVLGTRLMEQKAYEKAVSVFQEVIRKGAQSTYRVLVGWLVVRYANGDITALQAANLTSQLDSELHAGEDVTPERLLAFFTTLQNPAKGIDAKFFETGAKIRTLCDRNYLDYYWDFLLKFIRKQEDFPIVLKMQMHLVEHRSPQRIMSLPTRINTKKWAKTLKKFSMSKLRSLTITYLLQSKPKDCKILLENIRSAWIEKWVEKSHIDEKITHDNLAKAQFFWKGLKRILKAWKINDELNIYDIQSMLKRQTGLAQANRNYKKCLELCSKHLEDQPPSTYLPEFKR
ncbi:MAG: hypothetical protein ACK5MA_07115 [Parachlamydiaceae bacterium]